jgi:hypothetical protein
MTPGNDDDTRGRLWDTRRRRRWRRRSGVAAKRTALFSVGTTLMVVALASVPTPLPGVGLVLFTVALYFLARSSKAARRAVKWSRRQVPPFSRGLKRIKPGLPPSMRRFIDSSDPEN